MDTHRQAQTQAAWRSMAMQRGWLARLLWPVSLLYGLAVALRHRLYQRGLLSARHLPVPVVVVGNLVVGGAGKTPTVLALVAHLRQRGWHPGVISRGHGGNTDAPMLVQADSDATLCGDEPLQIRRAAGVPVCVARRRVDAGRALMNVHPEVNLIVCDDGLQHLPLHGDVRIAVFDDRGVGNGWLLPAGLLREPWPPGPARAAPQLALVQTRAGEQARAVPMPSSTRVFHARRELGADTVNAEGAHRPLAGFRSGPVSALAAVARPEVFFDMLRAAGLPLHDTLALPDHADAATLVAALARLPGPVLCTEKDLVKLPPGPASHDAWAVPLQLSIEPAFFDALDGLLPRPPLG